VTTDTPTQFDHARDLILERGHSIAAISDASGVPAPTVRRWRRALRQDPTWRPDPDKSRAGRASSRARGRSAGRARDPVDSDVDDDTGEAPPPDTIDSVAFWSNQIRELEVDVRRSRQAGHMKQTNESRAQLGRCRKALEEAQAKDKARREREARAEVKDPAALATRILDLLVSILPHVPRETLERIHTSIGEFLRRRPT